MEPLQAATKELRKALEDILGDADKLSQTTNVVDICKFYKNVYEQHKLLEELTKLLGGIKEEFSKRIIPNLLEGMQIDSISTSGRQFTLVSEFRASIPENKREKGLAWLKANGFDMIVKENVNATTLSSAMREWIKDKGELPPEDVMTIHQGHYISMKKK